METTVADLAGDRQGVAAPAPLTVGGDKVFNPRIVVYNKGCAPTLVSTKIQETVSEGWTPANPVLVKNEYGDNIELIDSSVNLLTNILTWELGEIGVNEYAILTYQVKSRLV